MLGRQELLERGSSRVKKKEEHEKPNDPFAVGKGKISGNQGKNIQWGEVGSSKDH